MCTTCLLTTCFMNKSDNKQKSHSGQSCVQYNVINNVHNMKDKRVIKTSKSFTCQQVHDQMHYLQFYLCAFRTECQHEVKCIAYCGFLVMQDYTFYQEPVCVCLRVCVMRGMSLNCTGQTIYCGILQALGMRGTRLAKQTKKNTTSHL